MQRPVMMCTGATTLGDNNAPVAVQANDAPRSIVAKTSKVAPHVSELVRDLRRLMEPFTATKLRERRYPHVMAPGLPGFIAETVVPAHS
jgi:hypothetical protein